MPATKPNRFIVAGLARRWLVAVLTMATFLTIIMGGCRQDEGSWDRIQESGTLRIGVDPTFPPFALAQDDNIAGIDIDLGRSLASELMLEPQFVYFGYDGLYDALTTGQVDVLISALVIMPERTKDIAYTSPYFDAGLVLIIPEGTTDIQGMADLDDRVVSVELGALGHVEALEWQRRLNRLSIQSHSDVEAVIRSVADGNADAALIDSTTGRMYLQTLPHAENGLTYLPDPVYSEPYAMAVRIDERELLAQLNGALDKIARDGTLDKIIAAHLGP